MKKQFPKTRPTYTHEQKLWAAQEYYSTGSSTRAEKITGIPHKTILTWKREDPDFQNVYQYFKDDNEDKYRSQMTRIIGKGLDEIEDRIEHGDIKSEKVEVTYDDEGGASAEAITYRQPMSGKDLVYATGITIDKLRVSNNLPTKIVGSADETQNLLAKFEELATKHMPQEKVVSTIEKGDAS